MRGGRASLTRAKARYELCTHLRPTYWSSCSWGAVSNRRYACGTPSACNQLGQPIVHQLCHSCCLCRLPIRSTLKLLKQVRVRQLDREPAGAWVREQLQRRQRCLCCAPLTSQKGACTSRDMVDIDSVATPLHTQGTPAFRKRSPYNGARTGRKIRCASHAEVVD